MEETVCEGEGEGASGVGVDGVAAAEVWPWWRGECPVGWMFVDSVWEGCLAPAAGE